MIAPQESLYPGRRAMALMILFKIISRSWDNLESRHQALPGCHVEHVMYGNYVLHVPQGGGSLAP